MSTFTPATVGGPRTWPTLISNGPAGSLPTAGGPAAVPFPMAAGRCSMAYAAPRLVGPACLGGPVPLLADVRCHSL